MNWFRPGSTRVKGDEGGGERSRHGFSTKLKSPQRISSSLGGSVAKNCFRSWEKNCFLREGFDGA